MNKVILIGRLTKDIELKMTPSGKEVAKFILAVNRIGSQGADFITIVVWGKLAVNCSQYIGKGSQVAVSGRIKTGSYNGKNGRVYTFEVVADMVQFLSRRETSNEIEPDTGTTDNSNIDTETTETDIPF